MLGEPTLDEMVRAMDAKIDDLKIQVGSVQIALSNYVTQEQRSADRELADHKYSDIAKDLAELKSKGEAGRRMALSAFIAPVLVGLVMWMLLGAEGRT